ncbi:MAG: hypothetical protein QOG84_1779 [Sphingomonadales bacterium]|jgi:hypothetical protein|nr:hypothetical protein [Sphingomonadales bacterium]
MSEVERQYHFATDDGVVEDLRRCRREDRHAFDQFVVFIQELRNDIRLCEQLIDETYSDDVISLIDPLRDLQSERLNVYIVKLYAIGPWRVLTAGDHRSRKVAILAILHRSEAYSAASIERLRKSYEKLGFTKLG